MDFWYFWSGHWCCWETFDFLGCASRAGDCIDAGAVKYQNTRDINGHWLPIAHLQLTAFTINAASIESHGLVVPFPLPHSPTGHGYTQRQCGKCALRIIRHLWLCTFESIFIPRILARSGPTGNLQCEVSECWNIGNRNTIGYMCAEGAEESRNEKEINSLGFGFAMQAQWICTRARTIWEQTAHN